MTFENQDHRKNQNPIARRKLSVVATSATSGTVTIPINGELLNYVIVAPDLTTDGNFNFTITNEDSESVYLNTGIGDDGSTYVPVSDKPVPMAGTMTFTCSFTTSQTATFDVYLYYR